MIANPTARGLARAALGLLVAAPLLAAAQEPIDWATVTPTPRRPAIVSAVPAPAVAQPRGYDLSQPLEGFPDALPLEEVTPELLGEVVTVTGKIVEVRESRNERMPTSIKIREDPALWVIYYPNVAKDAEAGRGLPVVGQMVTARGPLNEFREELQVRASTAMDIVLQGSGRAVASLADEATAAAGEEAREALMALWQHEAITAASKLGEHMDEAVIVAGVVDAVRDPWNDRAPSIVTIKDATGSTDVVFWTDTRSGLPEGVLKPGAAVLVAGEVGEHQGRVQLRLRDAQSLVLLKPAEAVAQAEALAAAP